MTERHYVVACFVINGDIYDVVGNSCLIKGTGSGAALNACWLAVNGNHDSHNLSHYYECFTIALRDNRDKSYDRFREAFAGC